MRTINELADRVLARLMASGTARAQSQCGPGCVPTNNGMDCCKCPNGSGGADIICYPPPVD